MIEYKNKKVAITGYRGYIGSALYNRLKDDECDVTCVDIDLSNSDEINKFFDENKFEILFHLAASPVPYTISKKQEIDDILLEREVNSSSILYLHKALKGSDTKVVFISSTNVYGDVDTEVVDETTKDNSQSLWASHKILAENYLNILFDDSICLRIPNVYGVDDINSNSILKPIINKVINLALKNKKLTLYKNKSCFRDYIHIYDMIDAILMAGLFKGNKKYYVLGCKEKTTISDVWNIISENLNNIPIDYNNKELNMMETRSYTANYKMFNDLTGWYPKFDIKDGICDTISKLEEI